MPGPLDGVRVIDLSAILSGPIATQIMGDQGADVIKVEPQTGGDVVRNFGAMREGVGAMFSVVNRSKRSIALDIKTQGGQRVLRALLTSADVLVENFRPGVLAKYGFGYDAVAAFNPRIVYGSISGFGADGPYSGLRAYDQIVQAVSGIATIQADPASGAPALVKTVICDKVTSLTFCQAVTAALFARERTGRGEHIKVAMLDAALAFCWPEAMFNHTFLEDFALVPEFSSADLIYPTADGYFVIGALSDGEFAGLWRAIDRPDLAADPRMKTMQDRGANIDFWRDEVRSMVKTMSSAALEEVLMREDVPSARINTRASVLEDPQVIHNGSVVEHDHPVAGRMRQPKPAATFTEHPAAIARAAPALGQHTEEVLLECGLDLADVRSLLASGAIAQA